MSIEFLNIDNNVIIYFSYKTKMLVKNDKIYEYKTLSLTIF